MLQQRSRGYSCDIYENQQSSSGSSRRRRRGNRKRGPRNGVRNDSIGSNSQGMAEHNYRQFSPRQRTESAASQLTQSNASGIGTDRGSFQEPKRWDRDRLSREMWKFYQNNSQSGELLTRKNRLRDALHKILTTHFRDNEVELYIVGSTANGLANNKSDVDICLVLSEINAKNSEANDVKDNEEREATVMEKLMAPHSQERSEKSPEKVPVGELVKVDDCHVEDADVSCESIVSSATNGVTDSSIPMLEKVEEVLKDYNFVTHLQIIAAKVPILKFVDRISGIEVTLNVNKLVSIRNTHLIRDYTKLDWRLQPLVMVVKAWANYHRINNAYDKTISSYSLVLMVIHYLQYAVQPQVLPCLQKMQPFKYNPELDIKGIRMKAKPIRWQSQNDSSLKELLIGFLDYYSYVFCFTKDAISIRLGQTVPKQLVQRYTSPENAYSHWKFLSIEEPFNRTNTARSVYDEIAFERILSVFRVSHYTIRRYPILTSIMTGKQHTSDYNPIDEYVYSK